jgi:hypothetical protein
MNPNTGKMEVFTWDKEVQGYFTTAHMIDDKSGFDGTWLLPAIGGIPREVPMHFYVSENVLNMPYFHRTNREIEADDGKELGSQIWNRLFITRFKNGVGGEKLSGQDFVSRMVAGTLPVFYTNPDGEAQGPWMPGPDIGVDFYVVSWNDADPASHPEFYETNSNIGEGTVRWRTYTREDGTLVIIAAYAEGASVQAGIFNSIESVIENPTLPTRKSLGLGWPLGGWPGNLMYAATKGASCPFFEITDSP